MLESEIESVLNALEDNGEDLSAINVGGGSPIPADRVFVIHAGEAPDVITPEGSKPWLGWDFGECILSKTAVYGTRHYSKDQTTKSFSSLLCRNEYPAESRSDLFKVKTVITRAGKRHTVPVPACDITVETRDGGTAYVSAMNGQKGDISQWTSKEHYALLTIKKKA